MIGLRPCAYAYAYVVFTSQSCDIIKSTNTRRTTLSIFLVLMLMSTQFSLAYTCACAYTCAYALVKTRLFFFLKRNGLSIYKLPPADCCQAFFYCKVIRLLKNEKEFHPLHTMIPTRKFSVPARSESKLFTRNYIPCILTVLSRFSSK